MSLLIRLRSLTVCDRFSLFGGHLSAYVALHEDVAKTTSDDPVEKQSSRVACVISFVGPTDWSRVGRLSSNIDSVSKIQYLKEASV